MDQAHEKIADMSAVLGFIEESVSAMKDGFLQGPFANIMPTAGLCRVRQPGVMIYGEPLVITGSGVGIIIGSPGRRGEGPGAGIGPA